MFVKQGLHCISHQSCKLCKKKKVFEVNNSDPLSSCSPADCRRAPGSESRPGLWERGNSESPEEEDELSQPACNLIR